MDLYHIFKWIAGPVGTIITGALAWAGKRLWGAASEQWQLAMSRLQHIEEVTNVATENHLCHIEENGKRTVELLEKIHENQMDQKAAFAEMNGYLKGISGKS